MIHKAENINNIIKFLVDNVDIDKLSQSAMKDFNEALEITLDDILDSGDVYYELKEKDALELTEKTIEKSLVYENTLDYFISLTDEYEPKLKTQALALDAIRSCIKKLGYKDLGNLICSFGTVDKSLLEEFNKQNLCFEEE
jgi:hypothetical protein